MSKKKGRKARVMVKTIKSVGKRCVRVLASGKWVFVKNSACGLKMKAKR